MPLVNTSPKKPKASDFPALRSFLRGYLHQDMKDEYGSPAEAAAEFYTDADPDERSAVAREWDRFVTQMKHAPLDEFNRFLTRELGSAYSLTTEDIQQISASFAPGNKHR